MFLPKTKLSKEKLLANCQVGHTYSPKPLIHTKKIVISNWYTLCKRRIPKRHAKSMASSWNPLLSQQFILDRIMGNSFSIRETPYTKRNLGLTLV